MFVVRIDGSDISRLGRDFAKIQARLPKAIARGLNQGGERVRTSVQRALKERTNVKAYKSITSRMRTTRAYEASLTYQIIATGKGIPIEEFPLTVVKGQGGGVDAKTWGVDHLFKRSFREKFTGKLRARTSSSRVPIRKLYGPALPKELGAGEITSLFYSAAAELVPPRVIAMVTGALK
jgi:hypothetical protein